VAALALALSGGAAQAHDSGQQGQYQKSTAAYVYLKKDPGKPASWENSTQQYLVAAWSGATYRDLTLDEIAAALPRGLTVCGTGWGVQEDQANGGPSVFTSKPAPSYPKDYVGWGPIFAARHWELTAMVTVPACATDVPSPQPSGSPSATPSTPPVPTPPVVPPVTPPLPSTPPTTPVPSPSQSTPPTEVVDDDEPTPAPSQPEDTAPVPTASPSVYSEVLAAGEDSGEGEALAATGSSPAVGLLAGSVLVLAGAAMVLLTRRRRA
jgi:LPXTG-motif cell wall-anchored protein